MDVRRAGPLDISAIIALLMEMHKNTEIPVSPISSEKLVAKISEAIHRGIVFVAIDEKNKISGSIGGTIGTDWWSEERHLSDMWFYVSEASRKTRVAYELVKNFISVAKEAKVPVRLGHVYSGDMDRKDNFFERLGLVKAGSLFVGT